MAVRLVKKKCAEWSLAATPRPLGGPFWGRPLWPLQKTIWDSTKLSKKRTTHINHLPSGNFTDCYGHWPIYIPLLNGFAKCELTRWYMPLVSLVDTYDSSFFLDHGTLRPWQVAQWPCAERSLLRRWKGLSRKWWGLQQIKRQWLSVAISMDLFFKKIQETNFDSFQSKYGVSSFPKSGILYCLVNIF